MEWIISLFILALSITTTLQQDSGKHQLASYVAMMLVASVERLLSKLRALLTNRSYFW